MLRATRLVRVLSLFTFIFALQSAPMAFAQKNSLPNKSKEKPQISECPLTMPMSLKPIKGISMFQFRNSETETLEFTSLKMFDQDPRKNKELKPDTDDGTHPHTWTIKTVEEPSDEPSWQQASQPRKAAINPWLVCYYGKKSQQMFVKRFAKIPQSCTSQASKTNSQIFNTVVCE